jgi:elongator complex protein 2
MIDSIYISAACNRSPNSLDWGGNNNQIIYGFSNSIAVLSINEPFQIKSTFNYHKDRVNCVKWIKNQTNLKLNFNEFISGSTDKKICVWRGNEYNVNY